MDLEFLPTPDITEFGSYDPDVTSLPAPGNFIPSQIATAYKMPASSGVGVKIGVLSLGGGFLQSDLDRSMTDLGLTAPTVRAVGINQLPGWNATTNFNTNTNTPNGAASLENTLDLFCVAGLVPNANITIYIGTLTTVQSWRDIYNAAIADGCDVITQSWSAAENVGLGDYLSPPLANAAAQGISVFNSTGDAGSRNKAGVKGVNYPASNANVIAVGGTILTVDRSNTRTNEVAATPSGGGISSIINLPTQQIGKTYQTYNSSTGITGPVTSLTMRGIPDIAAPFQSYAFYFGSNILTGVGGTSAATPIMAGMMARFISLNNGRRPPQNSIAKTLYASNNSFYDIISGNNSYTIPDGYLATNGWDPITGLGAQSNATQTYQAVTSAGVRVKDNTGSWALVKNIKVKTDDTTWTSVNKVWVKTDTGWVKTY